MGFGTTRVSANTNATLLPEQLTAEQGARAGLSEEPFESTISLAQENTESWGGMLTRYLLFFPNLFLDTVKTVIYYLSFKTLFAIESKKEHALFPSLKTDLEEIREKWADDSRTIEKKREIWKEFELKYPKQLKKLDDAYINSEIRAKLEGSKPERVQERLTELKQKLETFVQECNLEYLNSHIDYLETLFT